MQRKLLMHFATAIAVLLATDLASAITTNYVKDFEHPFVGLIVFYDADGNFSHRCSGSLLTPTAFLTAGHCVAGVNTARVWFQQDAGTHYDPATEHDPVSGYPDNCAAGTEGIVCATSSQLFNYGYPGSFPDQKDVGLVILDQPIELPEYGELPTAGSLDSLATRRGLQALTLTDSGYGLSFINPAFTTSFRERLMASSMLENLTSALTAGFNLQSSNNPGNDRGGTCFGDSGGPVFYGDFSSNLIVGVTSFGLSANTCRGADFAYRIDQAAVIAWILATVPPEAPTKIEIR